MSLYTAKWKPWELAAYFAFDASLERMDVVVRELAKRALEVEGVEHVVAFAGFNGATFANSPNAAGGFKLMLQDRAALGSQALEEAAMKLVIAANGDPAIAQAFSPFRGSSPRLFADVDREKAKMLDVPLDNVFSAMHIYLGSIFVNELNLFVRTFRVTAQADMPFRDDAEDFFG
jgi:multidrug efflux pump subunit AcrB